LHHLSLAFPRRRDRTPRTMVTPATWHLFALLTVYFN
jgi:hypothetical protein